MEQQIKPIQNKSRLAWIDYLRGIAIILVLYRHIFEGISRAGIPTDGYSWLEHANILFYSFRMPLFFILSGVFIAKSLGKRSVEKLIANKFSILLWPYFVWSVLQVTLQIAMSKYVNADRSVADYGYILLFPRRIDQFWYLYALFNVTVLYIITRQVLQLKMWHQLVVGFAMYMLSSYVSTKNIDLGFVNDILHYYLFFALGDLISGRMLSPKIPEQMGSWKAFLFLLPIFAAGQFYFLTTNLEMNSSMYVETYQPVIFALIALSGCAFIAVIAFLIQRYTVSRLLQVVGFHSLYIYVSHVLVASAVRMVMVKVFGIYNVPVLLVICLIAAVIVPIMIYKAAMRFGAWWLYSLERPVPKAEKLVIQNS